MEWRDRTQTAQENRVARRVVSTESEETAGERLHMLISGDCEARSRAGREGGTLCGRSALIELSIAQSHTSEDVAEMREENQRRVESVGEVKDWRSRSRRVGGVRRKEGGERPVQDWESTRKEMLWSALKILSEDTRSSMTARRGGRGAKARARKQGRRGDLGR
jgi:hypothetical protein